METLKTFALLDYLSYQENGDSSLIFMMDTLIKISENVNSGFYGNNLKTYNIIANNEKEY